jgi:GntR family transcriptional regulator/MocR family aminotransferase
MFIFSELIRLNRISRQPVYEQIANAFVRLIREGVLKPGARLPSIRKLAEDIQVHPRTVVAAYQELVAQDWINSKPRSGMAVAEDLPQLKPRSFRPAIAPATAATSSRQQPTPLFKYVINDGFPDYRLSPVKPLLKEYRAAFFDGRLERGSMYSDVAGNLDLRAELAAYYSETRGMALKPEQILITRGAQMAIYLAAAALIRPGDKVVVGEPNYPMANKAFEQLGAELIKVPVDEEGMDVEKLERICKHRKPRLLYIIPHHHHPTTVTLSAGRRMRLLEIIARYGLHVIEDDYDYDYHYAHRPILPLASGDTSGLVWYVGSLTKNLMASMRVGCLIAPQDVIRKASGHKRILDIRGDLLLEGALAALFSAGTIQRHIRKVVKLYEQRRDLFCGLLEERMGEAVRFRIPDGGMAVWVVFNKKYDLSSISASAATLGLGLSDGRSYNTSSVDYNALRMGFASLDEQQISAVTQILQKIVRKRF